MRGDVQSQPAREAEVLVCEWLTALDGSPSSRLIVRERLCPELRGLQPHLLAALHRSRILFQLEADLAGEIVLTLPRLTPPFVRERPERRAKAVRGR
jgi:hypothetical protein